MTGAGGRRRARGLLAAAVVAAVALVATACSVERSINAPYCEGERSSLLIVAQSVSTASQVPCLTTLPTGWSVTTVRVNEHHTVITFDSDRAGEGAAVLSFEESCDVTESVSAVSDLPAADRYDFVESVSPSYEAVRSYVFPGGCVLWNFDFDDGTSATESVAIGNTLLLLSRRDLNDNIRDVFIDEEL